MPEVALTRCPYCEGPVDAKGHRIIPGEIRLPLCLRCGHGPWIPRMTVGEGGRIVLARPKMCPKCKSVVWDKAK